MIDIEVLHLYQFRDENGLKLDEQRLPDYEMAYWHAEKLADMFKCAVEIVEVKDTAQPQKAHG